MSHTKTKIAKILASVIAITGVMTCTILATPTFADAFDAACSVSGLTAEQYAAAGCSSNSSNSNDFGNVIQQIVSIIVGISGSIALVFIIIGGVKYMTANGDATKIKNAKETITHAAIGLVICALAFAITNWVIAISTNGSTGGGSGGGESQQGQDDGGDDDIPVSPTDDTPPDDGPGGEKTEQVTEPDPEPEIDPEPEPEPDPEPESAPKTKTKKTNTKTSQQKLVETINKLAWPYGTTKAEALSNGPTDAYRIAVEETNITEGEENSDFSAKKKACRLQGMACGMFVGVVFRYSGVDPDMPKLTKDILAHVQSSSHYVEVTDDFKPGDIIIYMNSKDPTKTVHTEIVTEIDGKIYTAKAAVCEAFGFIYRQGTPSKKKYTLRVFRRID